MNKLTKEQDVRFNKYWNRRFGCSGCDYVNCKKRYAKSLKRYFANELALERKRTLDAVELENPYDSEHHYRLGYSEAVADQKQMRESFISQEGK